MTDGSDCSRHKESVFVVYTHFPHYRRAVFESLSRNEEYDFYFSYDPEGVDDTIASGEARLRLLPLRNVRIGPLIWQCGLVPMMLKTQMDYAVFLGNPYNVSTWVAAAIARFRGVKTLFWTHGWLRKDAGIKGLLRRVFYRVPHALLVYGNRARQIGVQLGFAEDSIHVIGNSLDYEEQKAAREAVMQGALCNQAEIHGLKPNRYFLIVSRLVSAAKIDLAIEALALMPQQVPLVVVGAGPCLDELKSKAMNLGVDVRFLGQIYDENVLAGLFLNTAGVVSPGKVGLLAMHALAYGAVVITHGDFDQQMPEVEALTPGVTGLFFKLGDVESLAQQMTLLIQSEIDLPAQQSRRLQAIETIEADYTPVAQVEKITSALRCLKEGGHVSNP